MEREKIIHDQVKREHTEEKKIIKWTSKVHSRQLIPFTVHPIQQI